MTIHTVEHQGDEAPDDACPACGGDGYIRRRNYPCPRCNGTGDRSLGPSKRDLDGMKQDAARAAGKEVPYVRCDCDPDSGQ